MLQRGSVGVPGESLATLTLLRGADFGPPPSPFCSSVQLRIFLMCLEGQIPRSLCPDSGCGCSERGPLAPPDSPPLCFFRARTSGPGSTLSAPPRSSDRCPLARFLAVVFLWGPHLGPPLHTLGTPSVQRAPSGPSAVTR
ncbi:hypothetical protein NDU88_000065 [Pleurodeles waltl]|uniref:Uncharacterized protein n=1 Tax=Pleurodeles waltl TaxID=8319 RepID=A0AAV7S929_PLEWA|nr:hypothetical protein NDU88_000065 [Pleurodeles waltl]